MKAHIVPSVYRLGLVVILIVTLPPLHTRANGVAGHDVSAHGDESAYVIYIACIFNDPNSPVAGLRPLQ